ncbi:MAG: hypothetical protein Q9173_007335, partial [Seirophora scorigena]
INPDRHDPGLTPPPPLAAVRPGKLLALADRDDRASRGGRWDQPDAQDVGAFPPGRFVILFDVLDDDAEADGMDEEGDNAQDDDEGHDKAGG